MQDANGMELNVLEMKVKFLKEEKVFPLDTLQVTIFSLFPFSFPFSFFLFLLFNFSLFSSLSLSLPLFPFSFFLFPFSFLLFAFCFLFFAFSFFLFLFSFFFFFFFVGSFSGLGYLSLYFAGVSQMFDRRPQMWKVFLFFIPWFGAMMIAISRVSDYRHHWQDVVAGGILGTFFAVFLYRYFYVSLFSKEAGKPYSAVEYIPLTEGERPNP